MTTQTITVYRGRDSLRVVRGEHKAHSGSKADRVAVYPNARLAYATEADADVRSAILRIDPTAETSVRSRLERVALPARPEITEREAMARDVERDPHSVGVYDDLSQYFGPDAEVQS